MGDTKTLDEHIAEIDDVIRSLRDELEETRILRHQLVIARWNEFHAASRAQPVEGER